MKRWVLYAVALIAIAAAKPFRGTDVAKLQPVEVLCVSVEGGEVLVRTDTGDSGSGENLAAALKDLKETTPGDVFLETADHLILSAKATLLLPELMQHLRPGCCVCVQLGTTPLEKASQFLRAHPPKVSLQDYRAEKTPLPLLIIRGEEMMLVQ